MKIVRLLPVCALLVGCGGSSAPVVIGAAGPLQESYGALNRMGIELAVEQINEQGGVGGRPLQVEFRDDEADGVKAAAIAQEFLADPQVVAVVGHQNSGAMMAAAKIYDQGLPAVATTATSPELSGISPWVFRVVSSDSANAVTIAQFADRRGRRRAALLYENDSYGRGLADAFRRSFTGQIVSLDPIPSGSSDMEPFVTYLKQRAPDLVFVAGTDESGRAFLREARRQGLTADFIGADGWTPLIQDTLLTEGVFMATPFTVRDPRPEVRRFIEAFQSKFNRMPDDNAALAYDATMLVARVIDQAGVEREDVRRQLAALDTRSAFQGVTGRIAFNEAGDPVAKGAVMTRVRQGALVLDRTVEVGQ